MTAIRPRLIHQAHRVRGAASDVSRASRNIGLSRVRGSFILVRVNAREYKALHTPGTKQLQTFEVLEDRDWHCRNHAYHHIESGQIAGSGGIQGLKRGTAKRPGLAIEHESRYCPECDRNCRHDRWTGQFTTLLHMAGIPPSLTLRAHRILGGRDIVDDVSRSVHEVTLDHKLPMKRWNEVTSSQQTNYQDMTDDDIRERFQLLKKSNGNVSHNLLKSRACEECFRTGKRGTPFGIHYFYAGNRNWQGKTATDANGCIGCGWYDIDKWRASLNRKLGD